IDPGITNNTFASPFIINCFEGLVTNDESGSVVPGSAEKWEISPDGLVYTFHLREGLKWSDGSPLTAADFVYAIQRVLTPATGGQYVDMVKTYVKNAEEYYAGKSTAEDLGVQAIDDKTLEITLVQPTAFFIDILSMWVYSPIQKATVEANGDSWTAKADTYICNGPFKITEMNMGESMVLVKNENYWDAANVTMDKVTLRYILDTSTALTAYESGEVDGIRDIPSSDFARLKAENAGIQTRSSYGTVYYNINCTKEPYNNPLVRKALNLAIDRQSIIDNVVQVDAEPAYNFTAPGYVVDGVDVTEGRSNRGLSPTADVEAAQAALKEAGYPNGEGFPTLKLSFYSNDTVKKVVEAMAEMLETNLNIKVEVTSNDWAIFFEDVQKGDYEVAAMGWSADYMHPMSFLPLLVTGDSNNHSFYSNPEYDALVTQVMAETDRSKAVPLIQKAEDLAMDDYPFINLYYKGNNYLMKDYVTGYYMTSSASLFFKHASVKK
ncbi:MAG: peptide ABC transporter substrate-binding protein, partial [Hungatella sp.]